MSRSEEGLRIDLGCGKNKKEGTLGLEIQAMPGVDYVLNLETRPLPFNDRSVVYVHSSHFLEHIANPNHLFGEISRVCADGARLELWPPHVGSNPGFVLGHKVFFAEDIYLHMCVCYVDFWREILRARWILDEFRYVIQPQACARCSLKESPSTSDSSI